MKLNELLSKYHRQRQTFVLPNDYVRFHKKNFAKVPSGSSRVSEIQQLRLKGIKTELMKYKNIKSSCLEDKLVAKNTTDNAILSTQAKELERIKNRLFEEKIAITARNGIISKRRAQRNDELSKMRLRRLFNSYPDCKVFYRSNVNLDKPKNVEESKFSYLYVIFRC